MSKADGIKSDKAEGDHGSRRGVQPKRKKGYHRALKRGDSWALMKKMLNNYANDATRYMLQSCLKSPLLIGSLKEQLTGETIKWSGKKMK